MNMNIFALAVNYAVLMNWKGRFGFCIRNLNISDFWYLLL